MSDFFMFAFGVILGLGFLLLIIVTAANNDE